MTRLEDKTVFELRAIYAGLGFHDGNVLDKNHLIQNIQGHREITAPPPLPPVIAPEYDARLMDRPPAKRSDVELIKEHLKPYTDMGMHLTFPHPEQWHIQHGKKEDSGSIRQKPMAILRCAAKLMK